MKNYITIFCILFTFLQVLAQENDTILNQKIKVNHAEPLYIDLMRDLGARKGEAEINVGFGLGKYKKHNEYYGFVEYEWAVADRLGLEVEIPFSFNQKSEKGNYQIPGNKIEGIKLATQYTFAVNEKRQMSLGVAYLHEFKLNTFNNLNNQELIFTGMKMNPVFIGAKNFSQWNTILYTGPVIEHHYKTNKVDVGATINASLLYVIPNSKHFIGIENNMDIDEVGFHYTLRPQFKLALKDNLMIGLVGGFPLIKHEDLKMDLMTRIIWEP